MTADHLVVHWVDYSVVQMVDRRVDVRVGWWVDPSVDYLVDNWAGYLVGYLVDHLVDWSDPGRRAFLIVFQATLTCLR